MRFDALKSRTGPLVTIAVLWLTFTAYSMLRVPVPGVNEPHFLTKARHYWQPEWCAGDLFLESSNAHVVFFQTVGGLTALVPLETAAVIGRLLACLLLAVGWERLLSRIVPGFSRPVLIAWLFLLLQTLGNLSGEWLVGGVEAKTFAYALVMWAGGALLAGQVVRCGLLVGLAVSFHPVVGAWSALCIAGALAARLISLRAKSAPPNSAAREDALTTITPRQLGLAAACFLAASAPGLIPAVTLLLEADPHAALQANTIQVGSRLRHHLDPLAFSLESYRYFGLLAVIWLLLRRSIRVPIAMRRLEWFTLSAIAIAVCGWLAAQGPRPIEHLPMLQWRIAFLKLYPFRLADLAVPLTTTVAGVIFLDERLRSGELHRYARLGIHTALAGALLLAVMLPGRDRNPSRMSTAAHSDWLDACGWLLEHAGPSSLVYAHGDQWALKWYAERPEYVNHKDCPQDAAGINEWDARRLLIADWISDSGADGRISISELDALHDRTDVEYLIVSVSRFGPVDARPAYQNFTFRVYRLGGEQGEADR